MKARLVRIGNSRGVRLPKAVIDQVGLSDEVDLEVGNGAVIIRPARAIRQGWAEACKEMVARGEGALLDLPTSTRFDREEWEW